MFFYKEEPDGRSIASTTEHGTLEHSARSPKRQSLTERLCLGSPCTFIKYLITTGCVRA